MSRNRFLDDFFEQLKISEKVISSSLGIKLNFTKPPTIEVIKKRNFLTEYKQLEKGNDAKDSSLFVDISLSVGNRDISYTAEYSVNQNMELDLQGKPAIEMDFFPGEVDTSGNIRKDLIPTIKATEEMITGLLGVVIESSLQFT